MESPSVTKKVTASSHAACVCLHRGLESLLCEVEKGKQVVPWRPEDVRDARTTGYLREKAIE